MGKNRRKPWTAKRGETLVSDLDLLIGDLCALWGLCNQLAPHDLLHDGAVEADGFAVAVLRAEGLDSEIEMKLRRNIRRAFVERYGQSRVHESGYWHVRKSDPSSLRPS